MLETISTEEQYDEALAIVYDLMQLDLTIGSTELEELEALSILIKEYENEYHQVPSPNKSRVDRLS